MAIGIWREIAAICKSSNSRAQSRLMTLIELCEPSVHSTASEFPGFLRVSLRVIMPVVIAIQRLPKSICRAKMKAFQLLDFCQSH